MAQSLRRLLPTALLTASRWGAADHQLLARCSAMPCSGACSVQTSTLFGTDRAYRWQTSGVSCGFASEAAKPGEPDASSSSGKANGVGGGAAAGQQQESAESAASDSGDDGGPSREELQAALQDQEKETERLHAEVDKLTDTVKRSLADMENLRQRTAREMESTRKFAVQNFVKGLFDVADNLGRAIEAVPAQALEEGTTMPAEQLAGTLRGLVAGLTGTEKMLHQALKASGVEQYNPLGEEFDPNLHNALFEVPDPTKTPNTIAVVTKRGYKMHDRVVRPAEVGVFKA